MPRIRLKAGEQRVWLLYQPEWTVQAFKAEISRLLGIKQNFSLELDGYVLLDSLTCELLNTNDVIDVILDSSAGLPVSADDERPVKRRKLTSATELLASLPLPTVPYYQTALPAVKPANPADQVQVHDVLVDEAMATGSSSEDNDFQPGASSNGSAEDSDMEETSSEEEGLELPPTQISSGPPAASVNQAEPIQVDQQPAIAIEYPQLSPTSPPLPAQNQPVHQTPQPNYTPNSSTVIAQEPLQPQIESPHYSPASPNFSPDIQIPTPIPATSAPTTQPANAMPQPVKTVFPTTAVPGSSESSSSSDSSSSSSSSSDDSSDDSSSDEEQETAKPIQHLTSVARSLPATKSGLTMPALYHPDIIKPAYYWVAKLVGFTEEDFPKLAGATKPVDASIETIPCSAQVTAWIAAGRQAEASRYVQRQKERHLKKPQAAPGKGKTATQNRNARRRAKQQADKAKSLLKSNGVPPASKQPATAGAASFVQPPPAPVSAGSQSTAKPEASTSAIPLTHGTTSAEQPAEPKVQPKPIDRFAKLLGHMISKPSSPASTQPPPSVPTAPDQLDTEMTASASLAPTPPAVDEITAAKAAAMQSLNSMEERDLQMLSSKNKNKSKNKKNRKKDASGAEPHIRFFGDQTDAKSRVVPPAAPSSRSSVPDNIIVSWVDVEDRDWVPGQATVQLRGAGVKQNGYETEGEWKGYPVSREVVDEHWRTWKRALTGDILQDGDKIAFQVPGVDLETYTPELFTYWGRLNTISSTEGPDPDLIPTAVGQSQAVKKAWQIEVKLYPECRPLEGVWDDDVDQTPIEGDGSVRTLEWADLADVRLIGRD